MNLYIIGPVTGIPDLNRAAFAEARSKLAAAGYNVRIPHDFIPEDATHEEAMRMSITYMMDSDMDGVAMLRGWECSYGAGVESDVAYACGIPILLVDYWLDIAEKGGN